MLLPSGPRQFRQKATAGWPHFSNSLQSFRGNRSTKSHAIPRIPAHSITKKHSRPLVAKNEIEVDDEGKLRKTVNLGNTEKKDAA